MCSPESATSKVSSGLITQVRPGLGGRTQISSLGAILPKASLFFSVETVAPRVLEVRRQRTHPGPFRGSVTLSTIPALFHPASVWSLGTISTQWLLSLSLSG